MLVILLSQITVASVSESEFITESANPLADWTVGVRHEYTGWYFESLPLSSIGRVDIREEYCAKGGEFYPGSCNLIYYYNSSREEDPWMVWNKSRSDEDNDITQLNSGMGFWVHADVEGRSGEWEGNEIDPIYGTGSWAIYGNPGWNAMGWTSSIANPYENLSSDTLQAINKEHDQNYTVQWGNHEQYDDHGIEPYIEEIYPENESGVFTWNHTNTSMSNAYWVCNDDDSLEPGYCEHSMPPKMPWQNQQPELSDYGVEIIEDGEGSTSESVDESVYLSSNSYEMSYIPQSSISPTIIKHNGERELREEEKLQLKAEGEDETEEEPGPLQTEEDTYVFHMNYSDPEGEPPMIHNVTINGEDHVMNEVSGGDDYSTPTRYEYETTLEPGTYNYSFTFTDDLEEHIQHRPWDPNKSYEIHVESIPEINLTYPEEGETLHTEETWKEIDYTFNASDQEGLDTCSLLTNESGEMEVVATDESPVEGENTITHNTTETGSLKWNVECTDIENNTGKDEEKSFVLNQKPVAQFTYENLENWNEYEFNATDSYDPDGEIVSYEWEYGDGETGETEIVHHDYNKSKEYEVELTVTDDNGGTNTETETIIVNQPPEVDLESPGDGEEDVPTPADLEVTVHNDFDNNKLNVTFINASDNTEIGTDNNVEDGETATTQWSELDTETTYNWYVEVTDGINTTTSDTWSFTTQENQPPVAKFNYTELEWNKFEFDATESYDPDGEIVSYDWKFGDGKTGSGETTTHTYDELGTYTVELTVTDDHGATDTETKTVEVESKTPEYSDFNVEHPNKYDPDTETEVSITWTDETENFELSTLEHNFTGEPSNITDSLTPTGGNHTYSEVLGAGTYYVKYYGEDEAELTNQTEKKEFTINKADAGLNIDISPSSTVTYGTKTTAEGTGCPEQLTCTLEKDGTQVQDPHTDTLAAGNYQYNYSTEGNENYTSEQVTDSLEVQKAEPSMESSLTTSITYGTASDYTAQADNTGDSDITYTLTRNGEQIDQGESVSDNEVLSAGNHEYKYSATEGENYTSKEITDTLEVQKAEPGLKLTIDPDTEVEQGTETTAEGTSCPGQLDCTLEKDGEIKNNPHKATLDIGTYEYSYSTGGNENYTSEEITKTLEVTIPYTEINTCNELQDIEGSGYYKLGNDIDCSGINNFKPIIANDRDPFYLDGQGYVIENVHIDRPDEDYVGVFGHLKYDDDEHHDDITVENLGVENVDITGKNYVGGLVGRQSYQAKLKNTYATGTVEGNRDVGGLSGHKYDDIIDSWASADVTGNTRVGCVVGWDRQMKSDYECKENSEKDESNRSQYPEECPEGTAPTWCPEAEAYFCLNPQQPICPK